MFLFYFIIFNIKTNAHSRVDKQNRHFFITATELSIKAIGILMSVYNVLFTTLALNDLMANKNYLLLNEAYSSYIMHYRNI